MTKLSSMFVYKDSQVNCQGSAFVHRPNIIISKHPLYCIKRKHYFFVYYIQCIKDNCEIDNKRKICNTVDQVL